MDPVRKDAKRAVNALIELRSIPLSLTVGAEVVDFKRFGAVMKEVIDGEEVPEGPLAEMLLEAFDLSVERVEQELGKMAEGAKLMLVGVKAVLDNYAHQIEEMREKDTKVFYEIFITDQDRKEMAVEREGEEVRRVLDFDPSKRRNR